MTSFPPFVRALTTAAVAALLATIIGLTIIGPGGSAATAQELQTLRDEVRVDDPDPPRGNSSPGPDHSQDYDHYDDDGSYSNGGWTLDGLLAVGVFGTIGATSPYWVPVTLLADGPSKSGNFPAYPYQYDVGYMLIEPSDVGYLGTREPYPWALRARGEYGTALTGLDWVGGNLVLETATRLGIESDFRFYQEDVSNSLQPQFDSAYVGDVNFVYRFAQSEHWQFRSGLGVNFLSDKQQSDLGFNFTYGADCYPLRPWVISAEIDWGLLGDETLIHFRASTGVQWNGLEAFVAYDLYDVGKFDNISLVTGIRLWF
jgi:hypothetical protein